jgi:hypothetical protein
VSERHPDHEADGEPHTGLDPGSVPETPRRAAALWIAVAVVVLVTFVVLHLPGVMSAGH